MKITFLMPSYPYGPSGGPRVVYEYANRLAARGHTVAVVHPLRLKCPPPERLTAYEWVRRKYVGIRRRLSKPSIDWQPIDNRVQLLFVPSSDDCYIPEADALFATSWHTVASVLQYPAGKGEKCYLIQGYEVWQGPKDLVDATWRAPLHKVVVAKWLREVGDELGSQQMTYIPNAINHDLYRVMRSLEERPRQVVMAFSTLPVKGSADGIRALEIAKRGFPDTKIIFFSTSRRQPWIPKWVEYHRNPPQNFIVNEIFNRSSIYLCPSLSEGWPLPPAEAAACGCAVVSTGNGGVREYMEHGVTGLLSPPGDPERLAENLCRLLGDDDLRIRLAKALNSFVSRLSWERSADLMEDFIAGVTKRQAQSLQNARSEACLGSGRGVT